MRVLAVLTALGCVAAAPHPHPRPHHHHHHGEPVIRKDWDAMTHDERGRFTQAVRALKEAGTYDELVYMHREAYLTPCPWEEMGEKPDHLYRNGDQKGPAFLPWHREQLMIYEHALQEASGDPTMAVPYWNYMRDSVDSDPTRTTLWNAETGIGGDGREGDHVVADGPFSNWPLKYADLGEAYLERSLGQVFSHPSVGTDFLSALQQAKYDEPPFSAGSKAGFRNWVEGFYSERGAGRGEGEGNGIKISLHAAAHAFVGRSMINSTSPNDPVFYMLHAFTDALWWAWQERQLAAQPGTTETDHFQPHSGGPRGHNLDDAMVSLHGVTPRHVLTLQTLPYRYQHLPNPGSDVLAYVTAAACSAPSHNCTHGGAQGCSCSYKAGNVTSTECCVNGEGCIPGVGCRCLGDDC